MTIDDSQKNSNSPTQCGKSNESPNRTEAEVPPRSTEPKPPVSKDECRKSCNTKKHWLDYATFVIEILGLFGLATYAVLTFGIWCANKTAAIAAKGANEASHQALIRSNRPWIGQSADPYFIDKPIVTLNSVQSAGVVFEMHNYGNSPAIYVNMHPPKTPETFFEQSDKDIEIACRMADMSTRETQGFAYAGGKQAQIKNPAIGQTIFPNGSIRLSWPINLQIGQGTTKGYGIDLYGCIAYRDQFDETVHHTTFCYMTKGAVSDVKALEKPRPCAIYQKAD